MADEQMTLLDMDSILGQSLDDTPDAPEFINDIPAGNYILTITKAGVERYESADKDGVEGEKTQKMRIRLVYSVLKTVELSDPTETPVPDGSLFSETFMTNEQGMSFFKRQAKNVLGADNLLGVPVKDILAELQNDKSIQAKVQTRESKGSGANASKVYKNVQVHILGCVDDPQLA